MRLPQFNHALAYDRIELESLRAIAKRTIKRIKRAETTPEFSWTCSVTEDTRRKVWLHEFSVGSGPWWLKRKPMEKVK